MRILAFFTQITLAYSQWHSGEEKQPIKTSNDTEGTSKPIPATSPVQCILECRKEEKNGYFVNTSDTCFCLKSEDQNIFSTEDENLNGIFYKEVFFSFQTQYGVFHTVSHM